MDLKKINITELDLNETHLTNGGSWITYYISYAIGYCVSHAGPPSTAIGKH